MSREVKPRYYRVSPKFWTHARDHEWDSDTQLLAMYLLTGPHRNVVGCYRLPKAYLLEDLAWDTERLGKPFSQLLSEGFIEYDEQARVVLIVNALAYDAPENDNQVVSALKQVAELPATPLLARLQVLAEQFCERFAKRLAKEFAEQLGDSVTVTVAVTTPVAPVAGAAAVGDPLDDFDAAAEWAAAQPHKIHLGSGDWPVLKRHLRAAGDLPTYQRIMGRVLEGRDPAKRIGSLAYFDGAFADWTATHELPQSRAAPSRDAFRVNEAETVLDAATMEEAYGHGG